MITTKEELLDEVHRIDTDPRYKGNESAREEAKNTLALEVFGDIIEGINDIKSMLSK